MSVSVAYQMIHYPTGTVANNLGHFLSFVQCWNLMAGWQTEQYTYFPLHPESAEAQEAKTKKPLNHSIVDFGHNLMLQQKPEIGIYLPFKTPDGIKVGHFLSALHAINLVAVTKAIPVYTCSDQIPASLTPLDYRGIKSTFANLFLVPDEAKFSGTN